METTAGSLALVGSRVPRDARIVRRLRAAGAVILGKANLSEWANFRGVVPPSVREAGGYLNGWSARGGFTRHPYDRALDPCGSSSGSAVAAAANLCAIAIGTETDGSIVCPAGSNAIVGLKPSLGLIDRDGIIPIAPSQDTAGPMGRTVTDVAMTLDALRTPFGDAVGRRLPRTYRSVLRPGALRGARIGIDRRAFDGPSWADDQLNAVAESAFRTLGELGATLVDPIVPVAGEAVVEDEMTVLLSEFKASMAVYLGTLRGTSLRTLGDLIAFNDEHCHEELACFGQELFEVADATTGLDDPAYRAARARCLATMRTNGIDRILADHRLDAIVAPAYGDSSAPAVAGYPCASVPTGLAQDGRPGGVWLSGGFLSEPTLLAFAFDLEQAVCPRPLPTFRGSPPAAPPDTGICDIPIDQRKRATRADLPRED